ncbi:MAG: hypothetical protein QY309_04795 [Cyclobacteriaceae bacterium]|nr:MAG: hypothetical protein QY309_04795 [Cyclobacteriaceae bacterium]
MSKCALPTCGKEFEPLKPNQEHCSPWCRRQHNIAKKLTATQPDKPGLQGNLFKKTDDEKPVMKRERISMPSGMDIQTQYVFNMLNKDVDRWESEAKEQSKRAEKYKEEAEKLRNQLAEIKTEEKIKEIERQHEKPSGLSGLLEHAKGLFDNPHTGPVIADILRGIFTPGGIMPMQAQQLGGDEETNAVIMELLQWFAHQDKPVQLSFATLITALNTVQDKTKLPELIGRLVNIIKNGSTIVKSNGTASMAYGT